MGLAAKLRRDVHEGDSLVFASFNISFNNLFQINPLEAANAAKNKSKDIHLPSIDVNFGSNRILCVSLLIAVTCS